MTAKAAKEQTQSVPVMHSWPVTAAKLLVAVIIGSILYLGHAAFIPVALALLLALVLSSPVEALHKRGVARSVSAGLMLLITLAVIGCVATLMWTPVQGWFAKAPATVTLVKQKVRPVALLLDRIDLVRKSAGSVGSSSRVAAATAPSAAAPAAPVAAAESAPKLILAVTIPVLTEIMTFVIVSLFLLAGGPPMMARMTAAFVDSLKASHVLHTIEQVRQVVGRFYLTTTFINLGLGIATGLSMWAWGMPTPYLWGAMAAILNYIPYAGSATTLLTVTLVAIVSFETLGRVLAVAGTYLVLATLEGQVAQPLLVGRRMEVNPLLVFLGLWFGGLFWGVAGILLATPILVALKVIAENSSSGRALMEFLGPNDQTPERDQKLRAISRRLRKRPTAT